MAESEPDIEAQLDALLDKVAPGADDAPASASDVTDASPSDVMGADLADEIQGLLDEANDQATLKPEPAKKPDDAETVDELDSALADNLEAALEGDFQTLSEMVADEDGSPAPAAPTEPQPAAASEPVATEPSQAPEPVAASDAEPVVEDGEVVGDFDDFATVAAQDDASPSPVDPVESSDAEPAATSEAPETVEPVAHAETHDQGSLVGDMQSIDQMLDAETAERDLPAPPPAIDTTQDEDADADAPRQSVGATLDDLLGEGATESATDDSDDLEVAGSMKTFEQATSDGDTDATDEPPAAAASEASPEPAPAAEAPAEPVATESAPKPAADDAPVVVVHKRRIDAIAVLATINKPVAEAPDSVRDMIGIVALVTAFWGAFLIAYGVIGFNAAMAVAVLALPAIGFIVIKSGTSAEINDTDDDEPEASESTKGEDDTQRKAA